MTKIKFTRGWRIYNASEIAEFSPATARWLVEHGYAKKIEENDGKQLEDSGRSKRRIVTKR